MIVIRALDGTAVDVDENAVTLVSGPYPHDVGPHTYVHGIGARCAGDGGGCGGAGGALGDQPAIGKADPPEPDASLDQGLCRHHAPRPDADRTARPRSREPVVIIGDLHQPVHEDLATAQRMLNAHGAHV